MSDLAQHCERNVRVAAVGKILVNLTSKCQRQRGYGCTFEHDIVIVRPLY